MNEDQRAASARVFEAYNAMETTKRRHFDFLSVLEIASKKWNLKPTPEQEAIRASLLADHDDQVKRFKALSEELRGADPQAFAALWQHIGAINDALAPLHEQEGH